MAQTTEQLLQERDKRYAQAWRKTGELLTPLYKPLMDLLMHFPEGWYNWIIIFNKLLRILGDPKHIDSWKDIAGYATLVVNFLEDKEARK
jgi:predicted acylesterase/phospholipase RssA